MAGSRCYGPAIVAHHRCANFHTPEKVEKRLIFAIVAQNHSLLRNVWGFSCVDFRKNPGIDIARLAWSKRSETFDRTLVQGRENLAQLKIIEPVPN